MQATKIIIYNPSIASQITYTIEATNQDGTMELKEGSTTYRLFPSQHPVNQFENTIAVARVWAKGGVGAIHHHKLEDTYFVNDNYSDGRYFLINGQWIFWGNDYQIADRQSGGNNEISLLYCEGITSDIDYTELELTSAMELSIVSSINASKIDRSEFQNSNEELRFFLNHGFLDVDELGFWLAGYLLTSLPNIEMTNIIDEIPADYPKPNNVQAHINSLKKAG